MKKLMSIRRVIAGILVIIISLVVPLNVQTTYASTAKKSTQLEKSIEKQFGISITLSSKLSKDEDEAYESLSLLRDALYMMPDKLVSSLVKHFKSKGKTTTIALSLSSATRYGTEAGTYNYNSNTINLYIPEYASLGGSGTDPETILHEFGHMVQYALQDIYGSTKLKSEFTKLNKKHAYGSKWKEEYEFVFTREYASTDFGEDFAETFMASILSRIPGDESAPLLKKSEYIKKMIESKLKVKISNDAWRIYPQTPSKKYAEELVSEIFLGPSFQNEGTYQYKITRAEFYRILREVYIDIQLKDVEWEKYLDSKRSAQYSFNKFFSTYETNMLGKIKRKDVALILKKLLDHMNIAITVASNNKITVTDCDNLESKYKKAIQNVVEAKLMKTTKDNNFSPESYCTYEQAYYALVALYDSIVDE